MNRNGQPRHPLDALLADLRRIWGRDAAIHVTNESGMFRITVKCRTSDSTYVQVDTHEIPS